MRYNREYNRGYRDGVRSHDGCLTRLISWVIALSVTIGGLSSCNKDSSSKKESTDIDSTILTLNNDNSNSKNNELEEDFKDFAESTSEALGELCDTVIDKAQYMAQVSSAVNNAKKEAKIFLQNEGVIKLDYDGNFYIDANKEEWHNIGFCVYDINTGKYNMESLAKVLACKKAISSIPQVDSTVIYQSAYYIDANGKKKYCDFEESFYNLLPKDITNESSLKNYLGDYFISTNGYIFSDDTISLATSYSFKHMSNDEYGTIYSYEPTTTYTKAYRI